MTIDRVRIPITGSGAVGNSYMNVYFQAVTGNNLSQLSALVSSLKAYLPTSTTYSFPSGGDQIDETTGRITGAWTAVAPGPVTGTSPSIGASPCGFMIRFRCPNVINGRKPVGRMLFVPAGSTVFGTTGNISGTVVSAANTAGVTFLNSTTGFIVWHRPVYDYETKPPTLIRPGSIAVPNVVDTSTKTVVLRSRRD